MAQTVYSDSQDTSFCKGEGAGIGVHKLDLATGALTDVAVVPSINPTYLCTDQTGEFVYAACELYSTNSVIVALKVDAATGGLERLGEVDAKGTACCFVAVTPDNRFLVAANYMSGSVVAFRRADDGRLIEPPTGFVAHTAFTNANKERQEGPHAHMSLIDATGKFVLVPDLGADKVFVYSLSDDGALELASELEVAPGSGPRHVAFSPDQKFAFVVNELLCTVTACRWDAATGKLTAIGTHSAVPAGTKVGEGGVTTCAAIRLTSNGRFLFVSNRGLDSLTCFRVLESGSLELVGETKTNGTCPRDFVIIDDRLVIVPNQTSNNAVAFKLDASTGAMEPTGVQSKCPSCACLLPSGK